MMCSSNVKLKFSFFLLFVIASHLVGGQNPIVPPGMYLADPEAHVWADGKLYIYGSKDDSDDYWCSFGYHVLSTGDMKQWQVSENVFSSKGPRDEVAYHDELLFAPDCAYRDGIYYLYHCSPHETLTEGVATSNYPNGPFSKASPIKGAYQIDPAVLIDTDGKGYYYWGQGTAKVARLKPNLLEIDSNSIVEPLDELGNFYFHEGSSIRKVDDRYYLVFADESRNNKPTCLGYAISESPIGPFIYQGVIIDNIGSDPSVWNNHGSIEMFHDQWYVFYHRSTNDSQKFRKVCIEPITINSDGTIDEVEMTSQGAGNPISARSVIQGEWACSLAGNVRIEPRREKRLVGEVLGKIADGDKAVFKYIDFGTGVSKVQIKALNSHIGTIELRLDSEDSPSIGEMELSKAGEGYQIYEAEILKTVGVHSLHLRFNGEDQIKSDIDWLTFY